MMIGLVGSAKRDTRIARGTDQLAVWGHGLNILDCFTERHGHNVSRLQRNHYSAFALCKRAHGMRPIVGCEHPIKGIRSSATLKMSEHDAASFAARKFF